MGGKGEKGRGQAVKSNPNDRKREGTIEKRRGPLKGEGTQAAGEKKT